MVGEENTLIDLFHLVVLLLTTSSLTWCSFRPRSNACRSAILFSLVLPIAFPAAHFFTVTSLSAPRTLFAFDGQPPQRFALHFSYSSELPTP
jgi:hypothetical protein